MKYLALATDYDGTLATHSRVDEKTLAALDRLQNSGGKLILITGRQLEELWQVFPQVKQFDRVVAENGALLYNPETGEEKLLGDRPPQAFIKALGDRGVAPLSVGRVIVATWKPHENTVMEVIRDLGLQLQIIFNKSAVMVLPSDIDKATGLQAALSELEISLDNTVGVGDAENDLAFLDLCGYSVAVANALSLVKESVHFVTTGERGAGVVELLDKLNGSDIV